MKIIDLFSFKSKFVSSGVIDGVIVIIDDCPGFHGPSKAINEVCHEKGLEVKSLP